MGHFGCRRRRAPRRVPVQFGRRRLIHYRSPGPSQTTNLRLNALLRRHLARPIATVEVEFATNPEARMAGGWVPLELTRRPARLLVENAALLLADDTRFSVHNL